jgi:hypothetical protein
MPINPGSALTGITTTEKVDSALVKDANVAMLKGLAAAYSIAMSTGIATAITTNYPALTVRGVQYLDGLFYVMEPDGTIWNTLNDDDPATWDTLGFITAEFEPDNGVFLGKFLNRLVAFGQWSTELFWDAGNSPGSPLSPVSNGVLLIGCAHADSVAQTESTLIWMARRKGQGSTVHKGRFIAMMEGESYITISTPDVCRVLDADDLASVYSATIELAGHTWYILSLGTTGVSLVYDLSTKFWYIWTRLTVGSPVTLTTLTQSGGLATATKAGHGFSDGDPVTIAGATPSGYNLSRINVNVLSSSVFTYPVSSALTTPATGTITATGWTESYFNAVTSCGFGDTQVILDAAGNLLSFGLDSADDLTTSPINWKIRTSTQDNGNNNNKFCAGVTPITDKVAATGLLRYTDDDYVTYSYFRRFDLSLDRPQNQRYGKYRRRAWEWRYTAALRTRIEALELDLAQGQK